jgi:hypothetical protein
MCVFVCLYVDKAIKFKDPPLLNERETWRPDKRHYLSEE